MKKPTDLDDHNRCVNIDKMLVFCVECDDWHSIELQAMGQVSATLSRKSIELDYDTVVFRCAWCGADIDYLLVSHRAKIIEEFDQRYL